ncbi:SNF2 family N-terminal domain-containing protein [Pestalotiopsis sp. NC0098]|nr:SNF2 family N-terminal domain-containing protein [Pestalotiopsis sp. NC0098]
MPDTWQTDTEKIIEHLANLPDIDVPPERRPKTPKALNCELQPHQRVGLDWLMRMEDGPHRGSILADTMGLGKTIQALSLILEHPSKDPAQKTTLIVAPVSLQKQWKTEIEDKIKPGHKLKTVIIDGIKRKTMSLASLLSHDVVLTSYGTIRSEYSPRKGASTRRLMTSALFHRIILDEAHNIKNDKSQTAVAIDSLRARYRLCLTATPLMNRVRELYSLVRFLRVDPYTEWSVFNNTFIRGWTNGEAGVVDQDAGMRALRLFLPSVLLQRKAESLIDGAPVLRLPPLELKTSNLVFDPEQRLEYAAVEKRMQDKFNKLVQQRIARKKYCTILVMILRLRQFCCHPHLISDHGIPDGAELKPREMISLALKLNHAVVERIKKLDVLECILCNEVKENPLIISPCGHLLCGDCFAGFVFFRDAEQFGAFGEEDQQDFTSCPCNACDENVDARKVLCYNFFATAYGLATDTSNAFNELMEEEAAIEGNKNAAAKEKYMEVLKQEYEPSVKTDEVLELLSDIRKNKPTEKTLIFSVFTSFLDILEVPVKEEGYVYRRYDGSMGRLAREKAVYDFMKRPEVKVMLIGLQAGNAGLNLQAASQVIILDPFWNPSIEDQAVGRAHRFPQRRPVTVHRILIDDTIENRIIDLQNAKRALVGQVLSNENRHGASHLTIGEMATLLGIRSGGPRGPRGARGAIGVGGLGGPGGQRRRRD